MGIFSKKKKKKFFTYEEEQSIVTAIKTAEQQTSGEIKVHVESHCNSHPFERGLEVFSQLEMQLTRQRNGVLFYLALADKQFSIVADEGINAVVPENFWENIKSDMDTYLASDNVAKALQIGILQAGTQLKAHFPYDDRDENEIPDELSLGE